MKVLHVTPSVARADGGPAEVIRGLLPALTELGITADVVSTDKGVTASDSDMVDAPWVTLFPSVGPSSLTFAPGLLAHLRSRIAAYDVVHIHGFQSFPGSVAMRVASREGVPFVIEPHGALNTYHWRQNRLRKRLYKNLVDGRVLRRVAGAIYSSDLESEQGSAVIPAAQSFRMVLGVDERLFSIDRRRSSDSTVLYLGRITAKKRLDLLLRALGEPILRERGFRLVVAGAPDGSLRSGPELVHKLGLSDRIDFVGAVSREERHRLMSEAGVFVLPSEDESFGVAVAEAMAAGVPVVTSPHVGVAKEAAAQGALLTAGAAVGDIAASILRASNDRDLGHRGQDLAKARYRWKIAADDAHAIYESLIDRGSS